MTISIPQLNYIYNIYHTFVRLKILSTISCNIDGRNVAYWTYGTYPNIGCGYKRSPKLKKGIKFGCKRPMT